MTGSEVEVRGVERHFGDVHALAQTDLTLTAGSFTALVGPSGCGKSTLLDIIGGLQTPSSGEVMFDGVRQIGPRRETGIVFQEAAVLPWRTVLDLSLIHISEPTRLSLVSRMPSSA